MVRLSIMVLLHSSHSSLLHFSFLLQVFAPFEALIKEQSQKRRDNCGDPEDFYRLEILVLFESNMEDETVPYDLTDFLRGDERYPGHIDGIRFRDHGGECDGRAEIDREGRLQTIPISL